MYVYYNNGDGRAPLHYNNGNRGERSRNEWAQDVGRRSKLA